MQVKELEEKIAAIRESIGDNQYRQDQFSDANVVFGIRIERGGAGVDVEGAMIEFDKSGMMLLLSEEDQAEGNRSEAKGGS